MKEYECVLGRCVSRGLRTNTNNEKKNGVDARKKETRNISSSLTSKTPAVSSFPH